MIPDNITILLVVSLEEDCLRKVGPSKCEIDYPFLKVNILFFLYRKNLIDLSQLTVFFSLLNFRLGRFVFLQIVFEQGLFLILHFGPGSFSDGSFRPWLCQRVISDLVA